MEGSHNMLRQMRGHYSTDRFMDDIDAVATEAQIDTMSFNQLVELLHTRYQPTRNQTMSHFKFHSLRQSADQTFDSFVNEVKNGAKKCDLKCTNANCSVETTLIRDQIITGVKDEDFRRNALKEEWTLAALEIQGRRAEAAVEGAATLEGQYEKSVYKVRPGKYSRKSTKRRDQGNEPYETPQFKCKTCGRNRCNIDQCPAKKTKCNLCGMKGQWAESIFCKGVAKKTIDATKYRAKAHYVSEESSTDLNDTESTGSSSELEQEFPSKDKLRKKVNRMGHVFKIAGMRRVKRTKGNRKRNRRDFKVEIAIKQCWK